MIQLSPKDPAEIVPITFDFSALVTAVDSVTVTCTVKTGTDAAAASMLDGSVVISAGRVVQRIKNGIDGVRYVLRADAVSGSERYALTALLPVDSADS